MPNMIADIANSFGNTLNWDASLIGGSSLSNHASNSTTLDKIATGTWDVVVFQEQSQRPALSPASVATDVYPFAESLVEAVRAANPCASPLFYMTWGRQNGDADFCGTYPPVCTYDGMQARLRTSYLEMATINDASVAPVGVAWKAIRDNFPAINLYNPDESHPSITGTYLAACVLYASIFRDSPVGAVIPSGVGSGNAVNIQNTANSIVFDSLSVWGLDHAAAFSDLIISGILDGPLASAPRGLELYVQNDIPDLSIYGLGSANNGEGTDGQEFTFPAVPASAGDYLYVVNDAVAFNDFFGFTADYEDPVSGISGDDGFELFRSGTRTDIFGRTDIDGTGTNWEYLDGWAYRKLCSSCGTDLFVQDNWTFSGLGIWSGALTNSGSALPFPLGTYQSGCDTAGPPTGLLDTGLVIIGIFHGPLAGSPKGVEFLAQKDIADLSKYGLGCANNGGGTDGQEYTFPAVSIAAGTHFYVANDTASFRLFFNEPAQFQDGGAACNFNGNDAFELYESGMVIDVFGEIDVNGTGQAWEYTLSWAHRLNTEPDGDTFILGNWDFGPLDIFNGILTNSAATAPYPIYVPASCSTAIPPQNLTATNLGAVIKLSWDPVPLSVACQIQGNRITPPGPSPGVRIVGSEVSSRNISTVIAGAGTVWNWKVRCACNLSPLQLTGYSTTGTFSVP